MGPGGGNNTGATRQAGQLGLYGLPAAPLGGIQHLGTALEVPHPFPISRRQQAEQISVFALLFGKLFVRLLGHTDSGLQAR